MGRAVTELSRHTFELDLTSVCVSSGTIQLPLKMQHFFTPGRVRAEVDGQTLELEFQAPRRLTGLREHFAERGLRSNDRVRFELDVEGDHVVGLRATCVRRERPKAAEGSAQKEQPKASHVEPVTSTWESGGGVRVVKRVRIPGLASAHGPAELVSAAAAPEGPGADGASAPPAGRGWNETQEQEVFHDGITTVRAVRRRSATASAESPSAPEAVPIAASGTTTPAQGEVVRPIFPHSSAPERPVASAAPVQLSDLVAPPIEGFGADASLRRPRRWALTPRLKLAGLSGARQPHTSGPARAKEDVDAAYRPLTHERQEAAPREPEASLSPQPEVVLSPGVVAEDRGRAVAPDVASTPPAEQRGRGERRELVSSVSPTPVRGPAALSTTQDGGAKDAGINPFRAAMGGGHVPPRQDRPAPQPYAGEQAGRIEPQRPTGVSRPAAAPLEESRPVASHVETPPPARSAEQPLSQTLLIDDADFGGEYLAPAPTFTRTGAPAASLEHDIARVEEYLRSPGAPAIVRSEAVGQVLGIGEERAERALERISEAPDSVSRIRRGAYMVRRRRD